MEDSQEARTLWKQWILVEKLLFPVDYASDEDQIPEKTNSSCFIDYFLFYLKFEVLLLYALLAPSQYPSWGQEEKVFSLAALLILTHSNPWVCICRTWSWPVDWVLTAINFGCVRSGLGADEVRCCLGRSCHTCMDPNVSMEDNGREPRIHPASGRQSSAPLTGLDVTDSRFMTQCLSLSTQICLSLALLALIL